MVSISLSLMEFEYLRSLILADADTRVNENDFQRAAITVFQQVVVGLDPVVADMSEQEEQD